MLEKLNIYTQKVNQDIDLTLFTKFSSKSITGFNVKHKTIKLLENHIGENLDDWVCDDFFVMTRKAHESNDCQAGFH